MAEARAASAFPDENAGFEARNCRADEANTIHVGYVYVRNIPGETIASSEYILRSPEMVEPWSYDTPEGPAEAEREAAWLGSHGAQDIDLFTWHQNRAMQDETLKLTVEYFADRRPARKKRADEGGRIFYGAGISHDRARHFSSKGWSYFHPAATALETLRKAQDALDGPGDPPCTR